ncbi:L,D-transpeptidase family protein [Flavobacterium sp. MR2016-29]|uniref:L,D-transpeptidase family protein n=1 Tax=Flavobacterium sp. MR2016-29 TaxID=2783795 RepID=UPI00188BEEEB|nr:L,D-transpeptidase family protein [Flavobacterium sp. MR2016-29]MBF4493386.1 L,D-transpeptidase family protein [Flavobacterium sp. MR2016-29]
MKNFTLTAIFLMSTFFITTFAHSKNNLETAKTIIAEPTINSASIVAFFKKYTELKEYQNDVAALYTKKAYKAIWYDGNDINEFGHLLYHKLNSTYEEGVQIKIPYKDKIDEVFDEDSTSKISDSDTELLLTSMYILYAKHVYQGMDAAEQDKIQWYLPKKKISYQTLLDSIVTNPNLFQKNDKVLFSQYYKLQEVLKKYRAIEKNGTWNKIAMDTTFQDLRPDATSQTIADIRQRLAVVGDLAKDSKSNFYDQELMDGIMKYKARYALKPNYIITKDFIDQMNEPISDRIKTLMLNMERCRWIPPTLEKQDEFVMVNIPSFMLYYVRNGNYDIVSNVFIGTPLTKTVIFSGQIDRIVFSPYWYVPSSIIKNELKLKMAEDKNYLADHNMEWNGGNVRQKPGPQNALGLVKFMFPNPNDIYMHDTPSKTLFGFEKRIFSHGCINVEKAKELAISMLRDYPDWPVEKINAAMSGEKETPCMLKKKIPIYIGYFTAWVDRDGQIGFFPDVYDRDTHLNSILFPEDTGFKN